MLSAACGVMRTVSTGPSTGLGPPTPRVPRVRLAPPAAGAPGSPAVLDPVQAQVVSRRRGSGPLVLLGAPGTGKTTTLVEAVFARVKRDEVPPEAVLVLAPSRAAAAALRMRICTRLGRTVREPLARTPHAYAFGLLRRTRVLDGGPPPRLISGPEQDTILAELLAGHAEGVVEPPSWPGGVGPAIRALRGFRDELRDLLMRAVERGLGPDELADLGLRHERPDWVAAADVLAEYLDVTALATPGAHDPAGIVDAAAALLADDELRGAEHDRWQLVAVDDAQEATAATHRLLDQLVASGRDLLITGDPDAATQTFRGARPQLLAEAPGRWPRADGRPAETFVLPTAHRQSERLRAVAVRVAERIGSGGVVAQRKARSAAGLEAAPTDLPPGTVEVHVLASPAQEAGYLADRLRRLHLVERLPWSAMAVVVRSARGTEPLRRALAAAGIPVAVPPAEVPVRDEPAVVPFRLALRVVLDADALTPDVAVELLTGPIGGVDAVGLRRLRRALRELELSDGGGRGSDALLVETLTSPGTLLLLDPAVTRGAVRVAAVLEAGRRAATGPGATGETVLWELWQAAGLADAWRRTALAGGTAGVRADRDLDAVMALFEAAARYVDRMPRAGAAGFLAYLEGQELPADTLAESAPDDDAVALVTAQGAAGREWEVVAVAGVQEGTWPDLRLRSSLLGAQALADLVDGRATTAVPRSGADVAANRRAVLDDELRGFHVAVSRARRHLLVTAVRSEDELPSPFLDLVDPPPDDGDGRELTEVPRAMTLPALVAELRAVLADPRAPVRRARAAARGLAVLARAGVPGAHPDDWYGLPELTGAGPLRAPDQPVGVSPSKVEQFERCALRWLLEAAAGAAPPPAVSQAIGNLVHELAEEVPDGDPARLGELLDARIGRLGLGEGWAGARERERARAMVRKLSEYLRSGPAARRELVAVEQDVHVLVGRADIHGQVDRLERDEHGRLVVVDLKTGRSKPAEAELARHAQLGVYQLAAGEGGFEAVAPAVRESGGAELVHLGTSTKGVGVQAQRPLADDDDPGWARRLVETAAEGMAGEAFPAAANPSCRVCAVKRSCPLRPEGRQVGE
jgi:superfamily I DNA/RNA helicase/RecB family exonuclease